MILYMESPTGLRKMIGFARGFLIASFLFSTLILFNLLQTLSLIVRPFSKRLFRAINCGVAASWWGWCVLGSKYLYGMRPIYTGDVVPDRENAIVFANHQQMPDVIILLALAREKHRIGNMKWFVKHALKYVPGMGWGLSFLDCFFLRRNWDSDQKLIESTFSKFRREQIPLWLCSFPEGTRITEEKLVRSQAFMSSRSIPIFRHVLFPRVKGFVASVTALRPHLNAVYDVTIGYPKGIPTLWQWIEGWVGDWHIHVRRFPISVLPEQSKDLSMWLTLRYQEKDTLMSHFHQFGRFPDSLPQSAFDSRL